MIYILFAIHNRKKITLECIRCIKNQTFSNFKVVVFDDGSTDGSDVAINKVIPDVIILHGDGNYWWTRSMNEGLRYILNKAKDSDYILTLNDDTTFDQNYLHNLYKAAKNNPKTCAGTMYTEDKTVFEGEVAIDWKTYQYTVGKYSIEDLTKLHSTIVFKAATLPCRGALIPIPIIKQVGLFDEKKLPHYAADYEFFLRAKKHGFSLVVAPGAITYNNSPVAAPKHLGFFQYLFGMRSPYNIKNHLIIINRYCPKTRWRIINLIRIIIGSPLAYFAR